MAHFEIKNLSFSYPMAGGRKALDNINLTIERGQYVTFCGRSGCGKTTLLRQLKSALTPHGKRTGEILFDGTLIGNVGLREQSARIGYVMQDPDNQIVTDKVWHELAFGWRASASTRRRSVCGWRRWQATLASRAGFTKR